MRHHTTTPATRAKLASFARELRSVPISALSPRERVRAIRSHLERYARTLAALDAPRIIRAWRTPAPAPRLDAQGYTRREGSPTDIMLQLDGEARPRRLYARAFSNAASLFFRFKRGDVYVSECDLPAVEPTPPAR